MFTFKRPTYEYETVVVKRSDEFDMFVSSYGADGWRVCQILEHGPQNKTILFERIK